MDFESRRQLALEELSNTPMKTRDCLPPMHRVLWRIGISVRPPHYSSFSSIVAGVTLWFGLLWSIVLYVVTSSDKSWTQLFIGSAGVGCLLGLFLAAYYRYGAKKHKLTSWDKLGKSNVTL